jgi:hypothetical protein
MLDFVLVSVTVTCFSIDVRSVLYHIQVTTLWIVVKHITGTVTGNSHGNTSQNYNTRIISRDFANSDLRYILCGCCSSILSRPVINCVRFYWLLDLSVGKLGVIKATVPHTAR